MSYNPSTNQYDYNDGSHPIYTPNGTIKIYRDVPLDAEYNHTFNSNFGSLESALESGQGGSYLKYTLGYQSYSRLTEGRVRVKIFKGDLISCNYMQITNGINGENFPYWCFIKDVEYVNNVTSDIIFEIDYLQTFWDRFTIPANFIEREHCVKSEDKIGANLLDEHLGTGDLFINQIGKYTFEMNSSTTWWIIIAYLPNYNAQVAGTTYIVNRNNVPTEITDNQSVPIELIRPQRTFNFASPICFVDFQVGFSFMDSLIYNIQKCVALINTVGGNVVDMVLIPDAIHTQIFVNESRTPATKNIDLTTDFPYRARTGSFTPHNKKTYQYPFTSIVVSNNNGGSAEYKRELFSNGDTQATFQILTSMNPEMSMYIYPTSYRGTGYDYENGVSYQDFPKPSWSEDSFTKWWQQNKTNFGLSLATGIISTGLMIATGGASGLARAGQLADVGSTALTNMGEANMQGKLGLGWQYNRQATRAFEQEEIARKGAYGRMGLSAGLGAQRIAQTLGQLATAKATPDNAKVQNNLPIQNAVQNRMGFSIYEMCISGEMAEIVDKYFDMFGYQTDRVKLPNFTSLATARGEYNYVKMQNCYILAQTGDRGLPEVAQSAIQNIFNNGITIWRKLSSIGNYNVVNE